MVWEDEKYRIEITENRAIAVDKESKEVLASIATIGDPIGIMDWLKRLIGYKELGNPQTDLLWENDRYRLNLCNYGEEVELVDKSEGKAVAWFSTDIEGVKVLKKVIAFL
jgi:hypothetical protein